MIFTLSLCIRAGGVMRRVILSIVRRRVLMSVMDVPMRAVGIRRDVILSTVRRRALRSVMAVYNGREII